MQKNIKDFTETELKALAYDSLAQIEQCQANIKAINQELASRAQPQSHEIQENKDDLPQGVQSEDNISSHAPGASNKRR